jgi:hypothetical protein
MAPAYLYRKYKYICATQLFTFEIRICMFYLRLNFELRASINSSLLCYSEVTFETFMREVSGLNLAGLPVTFPNVLAFFLSPDNYLENPFK